jgi:hypothetical protein
MNKLQRKIVHYLTEEGHPDREKAFDDLSGDNVFSFYLTDEEIIKRVNRYLDANPRGFCGDGILRFKKAVGLTPVLVPVAFEGTFYLSENFEHGKSHVSEHLLNRVGQIVGGGVVLGAAVRTQMTSGGFGKWKYRGAQP